MLEDTNFKPRKVTDPNDLLDLKSYLCIMELFCDSQAITHEIKYHDKTSNIDGYIQLIDNYRHPVGNLYIQAKTYKSKYKGLNKAEIPAYFVAYALRMRNEVCIFFSVDANENKIYWKYISDEYIRQFQIEGDNKCHIYHFSTDEIVSQENVGETIDRWKQLFDEKIASFSQRRKSSEEIISENRTAFETINTDFHHVKNSFIERKEIDLLFNWVKGDLNKDELNVKLLVGNAGTGKSVVIKQLINRLGTDGIKCFAIKADRLQLSPGQSYNEQLELLTNAFSALIEEQKAVLVIDQIDALSQYITKDRNKLYNVIALIKLFSSDDKLRNVRIIVSCRAFDLEFDPKLSELSSTPQIKIGVLSKAEVETVLNQLQTGLYNTLDEKTITILQTPQHLNIFCKVFAGNKNKSYTSITELYDELWRQTIDLASADIDKSLAENILYGLAQKIYDEETLTPQWNPDTKNFKEANYLISQGVIEQVKNGVTFFHQSMYDYVFARYYTKNGGSFINDLLKEKKHQGLFVRSTINLVLDYERAKNIKQYKEDVEKILFSGEIRPHIQLMFLWAMANRLDILPFEKKCVKKLYIQNKLLFYSFIRRTSSQEWYNVIAPLILNDIKEMRIGDVVCDDLRGFLWNHVQTSTKEVFKLIDGIKDENTKNAIAQKLLYVAPDFSSKIVTKWYKVLCDTYYKKADFLESALKSNPKFVLDNFPELISFILCPKTSDDNDNSNTVRTILEDVCKPLMRKDANGLYQILKNAIIDAINANRVAAWETGMDYNKVFPQYLGHHRGSYELYKAFVGLLKNKVKSDSYSASEDIKLLLNQKEASCYEIAFAAMEVNPALFSEELVAIIQDTQLVDNLLSFGGDVQYYFLELVMKWLQTVNSDILQLVQQIFYEFKSASDLLDDKEKKYSDLYYPHLGYHQRQLICAIPESLRNKQIKKRLLELDRRFGDHWNNEKPDYDVTAAFVCGGLMSMEQYKTVSLNGWLNSFYGVQRFVKSKVRHFDERVHADAFKQCVSDQPNHFVEFVFSLFDDEKVSVDYKLSGLDGLLSAHYPTQQLLPYLWKSIELTEKLSDIAFSYTLFEIIDKITVEEGNYIDKIVEYLKKKILLEYISKYNASIEDEFYNDSGINEMLTQGINTCQGYAIHSMTKIGKLSQRKGAVYGFFLGAAEKLSLEHQLAALYYLQKECYDNDLYNKVMFRYANRPITDYLFLNADRMHWFWCNDPELIHPYFRMILSKRRAKPILVQIMFFGMQYEKTKEMSREMFESILSQNEEEVIRKIIPLAYQHLSDETYGEQSETLLRRFANDNRDEIRHSYFIWCDKMPESNIELFMELLTSWLNSSIENGFHEIVKHLENCCNNYPYECYQCVKMLINSKSNITYYDEEELLKILLTCYRSFMDDEDNEKVDEVMNVFDTMMLNSYSNGMAKVLKEIEKN